MKPKIGISEKHLTSSVAVLSAVLADEMVLYIKTRNCHWNVSGESFMELHKLFEAQYQSLEVSVDAVAERIGKLGSPTPGSMKEYLSLTSLKEAPGVKTPSKDMIALLLHDHESLAIELRTSIVEVSTTFNDLGTADFLTGLLEEHETVAWMLRRYLA